MSRLGLRVRLIMIACFVTLGFGLLGWRLFFVQVVDHERRDLSAASMQTRHDPLHGYRGDVFTSDGVLLARDVKKYEIGLDPSKIASENIHRVIQLVCAELGKSNEYRRRRLRVALEAHASGRKYVALDRDLDYDVVDSLQKQISEVLPAAARSFCRSSYVRRTYPRDTFAASVIGVTNREGEGIEGVERQLDRHLSPRDGVRQVQVGGKRVGPLRIFNPGNPQILPVDGGVVYTTIDSRIQAIVEEKLEWGVRRMNAQAGSCVVLDCRTGEVLALANFPTFNPNRFHDYPKAERELRRTNRIVESTYESGSVMKPFLMASVLEHGLASLDQSIRSLMPPGVTWDGSERAKFGSRTVRDVKPTPDMRVRDALTRSSNIGMSVLGLRLGKDRILDMIERFQFCRRTGLALPAEVNGEHRSPERWKPFLATVSVSFGYAIRVTPIQLARAFAAVVNGGKLLKPYIVKRIEHAGGNYRAPKAEVIGHPISPATSATMRELLTEVVETGTAKWLRVEGFRFGAKTGTARMARGGSYGRYYLASFEAFAPHDDPQVVVVCMVERPKKSIYGAMVAGPVVVEVLRGIFNVAEECHLASFAVWKGNEQ